MESDKKFRSGKQKQEKRINDMIERIRRNQKNKN
jgi:hypothetical protein